MNPNKQIENIVHLMERDDSIDAPADSIKWAKNLFLTRKAAPAKTVIQKLIAVLQIDLAPGKPAFGERSASASQERQMLFTAGVIGIDLRLKESKSLIDIRGQVLAEGFDDALIEISGEDAEHKAVIDKFGSFSIKGVSKGTYKLMITGPRDAIIIEKIEI